MNNTQTIISIVIMSLVTAGIRFAPFAIFGWKKTPEFVTYLGKVLPCAIMGMLVVYCLKGISFGTMITWLPYIVGIGITVVVQAWKRNTIYSILAGTVAYMILIRIM